MGLSLSPSQVGAHSLWNDYLNGGQITPEMWSNPSFQKLFNQNTSSNKFYYPGAEGPLSQEALNYWNTPEGHQEAYKWDRVLEGRKPAVDPMLVIGAGILGAGAAPLIFGGAGGAAGAAAGATGASTTGTGLSAAGGLGALGGAAPISSAVLPGVTVTGSSLGGLGAAGLGAGAGMGLLAGSGGSPASAAPTSSATLPGVTVTGSSGGVAPEVVEGTTGAIGSDSGIGKAEGLLSGLSSGPSNLMNKIRRMMPQQQQQQKAPVFRDWTKPMGYQEMLASSLQRRAG